MIIKSWSPCGLTVPAIFAALLPNGYNYVQLGIAVRWLSKIGLSLIKLPGAYITQIAIK